MPGMNMSNMQHGADETERSANMAMSTHNMRMNAHMYMTNLRPANAADQKRADGLVLTVRKAIEKYKDYHVALADGYQIFLPNVPQGIYHFTNWRLSLNAEFSFDPTQPPSLLYKKIPGGWQLAGAMFTARKRATLDDLNARVPLSVARWHKHVNLCLPRGPGMRNADWKKYGLSGSIATERGCDAVGGEWIPQIFNWMVHVYPFETDPNKVWAH